MREICRFGAIGGGRRVAPMMHQPRNSAGLIEGCAYCGNLRCECPPDVEPGGHFPNKGPGVEEFQRITAALRGERDYCERERAYAAEKGRTERRRAVPTPPLVSSPGLRSLLPRRRWSRPARVRRS